LPDQDHIADKVGIKRADGKEVVLIQIDEPGVKKQKLAKKIQDYFEKMCDGSVEEETKYYIDGDGEWRK
jgi:CTP:molybdopterin cytidylyltransferase MocA